MGTEKMTIFYMPREKKERAKLNHIFDLLVFIPFCNLTLRKFMYCKSLLQTEKLYELLRSRLKEYDLVAGVSDIAHVVNLSRE